MFQKKKKILNEQEKYVEIMKKPIPRHIAIILDGNGRWAKKRGLPRIMGHAQGIKRIEEIVPEVMRLGVEALTIFTFSTENWSRPTTEVQYIMNQAHRIYSRMRPRIGQLGYNVRIIGEDTNMNDQLKEDRDDINARGDVGEKFTLAIAFNYGSQTELINMTKEVATKVKNGEIKIDDIDEKLISDNLYTKNLPPVDLLIRTSGEERISNFLLWQISYAELYFPTIYWPDFDKNALLDAIEVYQKRNRRFGTIKGDENA